MLQLAAALASNKIQPRDSPVGQVLMPLRLAMNSTGPNPHIASVLEDRAESFVEGRREFQARFCINRILPRGMDTWALGELEQYIEIVMDVETMQRVDFVKGFFTTRS